MYRSEYQKTIDTMVRINALVLNNNAKDSSTI